MAQARNTFTKSKMNKDLDARLMRSDEYRDARNIQVSRSEGANVGSLENALGNELVLNINTLTSSSNQKCIGYLTDETNNYVYLFTTDNTSTLGFNKLQKSFILRYDTVSNIGIVLVSGPFLNFSQANPIIGVNLLEGLLFFTDNFNQPRVINVITAASNNSYYQTEDQISVAKYNPYQAIELWQEVSPATSPASYETTMQDVTTPYLPNGGSAVNPSSFAGGATITVNQFENNILPDFFLGTGSLISYIDSANNLISTGTRAKSFAYNGASAGTWNLLATSSLPALPANTTLVFNPNPYYDGQFAGDPDYLEDKFVRFSYRFKFEDNQYSIFAPFTQIAFIPKQDGYFLYVKNDALNFPETNDLDSAYRSTVVSFMENKVDLVKLRIPLPFSKSDIVGRLKISEMDILYKESNGLAVKVIDTISIADIIANPTVEPNVFTYNYNSKKPYKTLPENNLTRVYDKIPVKAFSQEIASNRIIYGNFQDKHTPPVSLDYSVTVGAKSDFNLNVTTATTNGAADVNAGVAFPIDNATAVPELGSIATGTNIPANASVTAATSTSLTLNKAVDIADGVVITFNLVGPDTNTVTKVEYPNSTLKQNRNYQVGVMLSDRYGRTSTVLLSSNNNEVSLPGGLTFTGDTLYSPYLGSGTRPDQWPGDSLKVLFNQPIGPDAPNPATGWPGIYKGPSYDDTSFETPNSLYNPLGWYSYKIVVKQTEQEYYNVYLPGVMAAYPEDVTLELGQTSHVVLINDNINKVPRDLSEVGPEQRQFRSSVNLFGRVNNTATPIIFNASSGAYTNIAQSNSQYYPNRGSDVVSTISTMQDLFDYDPSLTPAPNYFPQFYSYESNPLIARISTEKQIGQIATTNYSPVSGEVAVASTSDEILLKNVIGEGPSVTGTANGTQTVNAGSQANFNAFSVIPSVGSVAVGLGISSETKVTAATNTTVTFDKNTQFVNGATVTFTLVQIALGDSVRGGGLPNDTIVIAPGFTPGSSVVVTTSTSASTSNVINVASSTNIQPNQYVSAAGIPEGTIVQSKNGSTITVSNVVDIANGVSIDFRLPGKIKVGRLNDATPPVPVATPVTVAFDAEITIVSETTPGLQYLAVMETEPVESLLDIFWETTSTGLIEDLNTLILNSSEGGANFSSFNTSLFTEALATTQPILNANFTLVDFFGVVIPPANITSLTIDIVRNGNNTNVTNFFTLNSIGAGYFNVKTTAAYYSSIFFNNDANLRTFTITFTSVVTDSGNSTTTTYNETITLGNVDPTIPTATPAVGSTIQTNRYEQSLAVLNGINGANNTTLRTQDLTWEIISVFNTTSAPSTDIGPNGSDLGYFTIPTTVASNNLRATLTNASGGNMPPEVYQVNLRLSDALASVNAQYTFNMLIEPNYVKAITWQIVCDGEQQADNFPAVEIQITDGSASPTQQNGFYLFPVPWNTLVNANGANVITIDRTNARLTNPSGAACPSYGDAFFSPTSSAAVRALWTASDCTCSSGNTGNITSTSNIDVTGYLFEII